MRWTHWREHFHENRARSYPPDPGRADEIPPAWRAPLAHSLARFQLGESGEGRVVAQLRKAGLDGVDDDFVVALAAFIAEEGRHAKILGSLLRALGGQPIRRTWTHDAFCRVRRLAGVRMKLLVLLGAEVVAIVFYGLIADRLPPGPVRAALVEIGRDEGMHLLFHGDFFHSQVTSRWRRAMFRPLWWVLSISACTAVAIDHRKTLRMLSIGWSELGRTVVQLVAWVDAEVCRERDRSHTVAARPSPSRLRNRRAA